MHVELCRLIAPKWDGWEVSLVADGRHVSSTIFENTVMYNYYPRTKEQQIEHEARECAESMAARLGVHIVQTLIDSATDSSTESPK